MVFEIHNQNFFSSISIKGSAQSFQVFIRNTQFKYEKDKQDYKKNIILYFKEPLKLK